MVRYGEKYNVELNRWNLLHTVRCTMHPCVANFPFRGDIHRILARRVKFDDAKEKQSSPKKKKGQNEPQVSQTKPNENFANDESRWVYKQHQVLISQKSINALLPTSLLFRNPIKPCYFLRIP